GWNADGAAPPLPHSKPCPPWSANYSLTLIWEGFVMRFNPSLEELLDEMSAAIAAHLGIEIGKASLDNSPWHNALNAIKKAVESSPVERPTAPERALLHEAKHALTSIALCPRDDAEIKALFERIDQAEVTACRIADFLFESSNPEAASTQEGTS